MVFVIYTVSVNSGEPQSLLNKYKSNALFFTIVTVCIYSAYRNSFSVPLLFDDHATLVENMSIRDLFDLRNILSLPKNPGLAWRPFSNLTFAINYVFSGLSPWGYHATNTFIHLCTALVLYLVIKKTLVLNIRDKEIQKNDYTYFAASTATLWAVNPILTQSITYISQRTELLAGMFYLATLYCYIRGSYTKSIKWNCLCCITFFLEVGLGF